ncbi:MAG: phosphatidylserine/phosphatidylglycerophosphate/cardiolipin synthase family protein [Anaerolineae bacterium]|jgi:phosphatidylserine/phosphatidylglycerophosphate/cardiolipin synthase-like enzyme
MLRKPSRPATLITVLAILIIAQLACDGPGGGARTVSETVSGDWIRVYFTSPRYPDDDAYHHGGLDEELAAVIGQAESSVDVAAYDFDLERVADALIAAHRRGVKVRFVTDSDNADEGAVQDLRRAGIPVVEDERDSGLMHDKFIVIDQVWIWTGSWNLTSNGTYRNNNNAVMIASPALAENYTAEFEEMFAGEFGPTSPADTPNPHVIITAELGEDADGQMQTKQIEVENYFAPEDTVATQVIAEIRNAKSRIRFMAFTFTSDEIADALLERAQAGVVVQGVIEDRNAEGDYSQYDRLLQDIPDIFPDGNPYIMHHKVIIIDEETVILGSYNFTASAEERNDENVLIIHDPEVAALFVQEFGRVYETARTAD